VWLAEMHEAETVADLLVEFRDHTGRDWPSRNAFHAAVERLIEGRDAEYLLGAPDEDSPPAGVCQIRYRFGVWVAGEEGELEDLFVREQARRSGVGAALVEAALDRAARRGCRRMKLDVNAANPAARALYERFGFSSWSDPPGGDDLLMRLRLPEVP
jgi:GNAT superfamily N-acetyltransferase